jgi:hypothetical protein
VFSSRRSEKATYETLPFRLIAGGLQPDHATLANFRTTFLPVIKDLFVQMLLLAQAAGYVELGNISMAGSKVHANASKSKAVSAKRLVELEVQLRTKGDALLRLAEQADQPVPAGMVIADEIAIRQERLTRLAAAKTLLESRAQARYTAEKAAYDANLRVRAEKAQLTGRKPAGRAPTPPACAPQDTDQYNFTDPESHLMKNGNRAGFEQAYNAQAALDQASRFIVAGSLSNHPNDKAEVEPTLAALGTPPPAARTNGFFSSPNIAALERRHSEPYIATGRTPHHQSWQARFAGEPHLPPADASPQVKMAYRLRTTAGKAIYRLRKCTVEPVFGIVKAVLGFRPVLGTPPGHGQCCMALDVSGLQHQARSYLELGLTAPRNQQAGVQQGRNAAERPQSTQLDWQTQRDMPR